MHELVTRNRNIRRATDTDFAVFYCLRFTPFLAIAPLPPGNIIFPSTDYPCTNRNDNNDTARSSAIDFRCDYKITLLDDLGIKYQENLPS